VSIEAGRHLLHYRLIEKIGEGGMGVVWKAEDTKLHRHVALKVLPEAMARDPDRRARFEREARAVAALNHPNIVTLYSVEEALSSTGSGAVSFITMELVEGRTLTQLLPRDGLALGRLLEIAIPLADAVSRAHRAGITHRDLKPDNVMIDGDGRLRVLDFGLAKLHDPSGTAPDTQAATVTSDTAEGRVIGTVAYMSPEQAEGKAVDSRSDVFSLGTILYEMATGERPFRGDTKMSTIGSILKDEPASLTEKRPSLPRHAGRILRRCLAKNPERRYQSALELRNELEELKADIDSGIHDRPDGARGRGHWSTRRRIVLGTVAVLAVATALVPVLHWVRRGSPSPEVTYQVVPLAAEIGLESGPSWSPEGEFIAYAQVRNGNFDIMVKPVTGGEPEVRADGPGDEVTPRWSPDGRYLAYVSTSAPGTPVYLVPPHGGAPRKLIETGAATLDADTAWASMGDHPWTPDGRALLVSRVSESGWLAIYRVDRDNGTAEQLSFPPAGSHDGAATYSFDGERIAFVRGTKLRGDLMTMPAAGGEPESLGVEGGAPAFRPDGRRLVFMSDRGTKTNLWELDLATGASHQLTSETLHDVWPSSVSATDRIAYQAFWHDTFLFVVDVATGERRQLTWHTGDNYGGRFSPDGATIAYASSRTGSFQAFLFHLDGKPETQLTNGGMNGPLDWSPDGRELILASDREDHRPKLFIASADGGNWRRLVDRVVFPPDASSRWSPDGQRIGYTAPDGSLWTVDPGGGDAKQVLENVEGFGWYLDGRRLIYACRHGSDSELIAVDLDTGRERSLFVGPFGELEVAPDGRAVAFCFGPGHMSMGLALLRLEPPAGPDGLPRATGEPEYVVRAENGWHVHNGGWSPDSKSIVYTRDQDYGDIYELVERR
jgi:Tol biopolymer transport system component/tRNA A-37 threonylcarbamoyl transferase component Bud32